MNLLNVSTLKWENELLEACGGPELRGKLGEEPVPGGTILGQIGPWWVTRWGFNQGEWISLFLAVFTCSLEITRVYHSSFYW